MNKKPILPPALSPFVMQWGELGSAWGIGRSAARIHALLLISDNPLTADDITEGLSIARSNVSMSMKDLKSIGLVETHPSIGSRKEHFTAVSDPVDIAARITAYRKSREFDPARAALTAAAEVKTSDTVNDRLKKLRDFANLTGDWHEDLTSLSGGKIKALMKAGAGAVDHLPSKKKKKK